MRLGPAWRWALGAVVLALLGACATMPEPAPLLREDLARIRTDLARIEQSVQKSQAEVQADLQRADRQSAQTLTELQRSVAQLGSRLDELGREAGRIHGRLDELQRRVETLALQFDAAGPPPARTAPQTGGPGPAPGGPAEPARPTSPPAGAPGPPRAGSAPSTPAAGAPSGSTAAAPAPGASPARQASDLYQTAYIDYTRGNYNLAIAAFKEFIRLYPETDLAEKAQYWIAESHFSLARDFQGRADRDRATQEFERAVQEFRKVLINYPRGDRVPTALYKEALTLLELRQPALAEARLQFLVDQFPSTEEAAKAKEELARMRKR